MPYKNVHYVKLMLELFDDRRFIKECNDSQKLDYILWLVMAGLTVNNSELDYEWFKTRFNLRKDVAEIRENMDFLFETFSRMYKKGNCVKFKNFKKIHNQIRNAEGKPRDSQKTAQSIIYKIIGEYIKLRGWDNEVENKELLKSIFKRNVKAAKDLSRLNNDVEYIIKAMRHISATMKNKGLSWTLETIISYYPDFLKQYPPADKTPQNFKNLVNGVGEKWEAE